MRSYSPSFESASRIWWILAAICTMLICGYLVASGRRSYELMAIVVAAAPVLAWAVLAKPYLIPYGIYAILVPFDNLLAVGHLGTATRFLGLLSGIVLLLYALRKKRFNAVPRALYLWGLFAAWAVASIMWAIDPVSAATGSGTIVQLVLLLVVIAVAPVTIDELRTVLFCVATGGVAAGAYGAWTFYKNHNLEVMQVQDQLQRLQLHVGDSAIDVNHYANSLLFPSVILIVLMLRERKWWSKAVCALGLAIMLAGIYYSGSREALVGLGAVLLYLLLAAPRYRVPVAAFVGLLVAASPFLPMVWTRFSNAVSSGGAGRVSIWLTSLLAARDHWLYGAGASNAAFAYDEKYLQVFQKYSAGWHRPAHDIFLEALVDLGVVGFGLLVAAIVGGYRMASGIGPEDDLYSYKLMVQGGLIALMTAALFIDMTTYKYLWLLFATAAQVYALRRQRVRTQAAYPAVPAAGILPVRST